MFISASEVSRRAGSKKRAHEEPQWAKPIMMIMVERGILETDHLGRYRIKPLPRKKKAKWVAPDIAKILEENKIPIPDETAPDAGVSGNAAAVSGSESVLAEDEYYEQL